MSIPTALIDDLVAGRSSKSDITITTVIHVSAIGIACSKDTATCLTAVKSVLGTTARYSEEVSSDDDERFSMPEGFR